MQEQLKNIQQDARQLIEKADSQGALEELRIKYLGRKSLLAQFSSTIARLDKDQRPQAGILLNEVKRSIHSLFEEKAKTLTESQSSLDVSFPSQASSLGRVHPLSIVAQQICDVFEDIGFQIKQGKEIEDEWHNFQALNIPRSILPGMPLIPFMLICRGKKGTSIFCAVILLLLK